MNCRTARNAMVAARDGELPARRQRALERHLDRCGTCRAERVAFEGVLGALDQLLLEADVPARLEQEVLRQVRAMAADEPVRRPAAWVRMLAPAVATTAVVALAIVGVRSSDVASPTDRTVAVATPAAEVRPAVTRRGKTRAPAEPPAALASRPDLFMNLPMLREFDKIQHFDAIAGMDDDAPEASPPSSG